MNKFVVYIDDAEHALNQLQAMTASDAPAQWLVVACPPKLSRHVGRWVTPQAHDHWRQSWADTLFQSVTPRLLDSGGTVQAFVAKGELLAFTQTLRDAHGGAAVLDARRPKFGTPLQAVVSGQATAQESRWQFPGAVIGMGAVMVLALE